MKRFVNRCLSICGFDISDKEEYVSMRVTHSKNEFSTDIQDLRRELYFETILEKRTRSNTVETAISSNTDSAVEELVTEKVAPPPPPPLLLPPPSPPITLDPITLEPIGPINFLYKTKCGKIIEYNLKTIVEYLMCTGDFRDPICRTDFTIEEIKDIDKHIQKHNLDYPLLEKLFINNNIKHDKIREKNILHSLEACVGEIIAEIFVVVETPNPDADVLLTILFSEFESPFAEMKRLNIETAYQCLSSWKAFLDGPPKKPTINRRGRLHYAKTFLEGQWSNEDDICLRKLRLKK
jgi:hypothetical protein